MADLSEMDATSSAAQYEEPVLPAQGDETQNQLPVKPARIPTVLRDLAIKFSGYVRAEDVEATLNGERLKY